MAEHSCGTLKNRARVTAPCLLPEPFPISYFNEFDFPSGVSLLLFSFRIVEGSDVSLCNQKLLSLIFYLTVLCVSLLFGGQDLCIFYAQFLHLRNLLYAQFIKGRFSYFVKSDFFPMRLQKLFAVTNLAILLIS